ncbi:MAG: SLC13 family permease, partial [Gammaproteobacteria bacterium]
MAGPILAALVFLALPQQYIDETGAVVELSRQARAVAAFGTWMAVWWMTEAIPLYATALFPLAAFPLSGATTIKQAAAPYGHELIYLFLGGFIIALALERWGLHRRMALTALRAVGTSPWLIVGAFMGIASALSMWVTNTATTIMLLPVAVSVIDLLQTRNADDSDEPG